MAPRTTFTLTFIIAALPISILLGLMVQGSSAKMFALVFTAITSTTLLAYGLAPQALLNANRKLVCGAAIAVLSLFLVCILQYWLAPAIVCNGETLSGGGLEFNEACFEQELARVGFILLAPIFAILGSLLAAIATTLSKRLTHHSSGTG